MAATASPLSGPLLVVVAAIAFAVSGPAARVAIDAGLHPAAVAADRCIVAAAVLALVAGRQIVTTWRGLDRGDRGRLALSGAILGVHFALFIAGIASTSFAAAVMLVSLEPVAVLAVAAVGFGVVPTRAERAGVAAATLGAAVVASSGGAGGEHRLLGDLLVVGAVALYGVYYALNRSRHASIPPLAAAGVVYAIAALVLVVGCGAAGLRLAPAPGRALAAVVVLGLVPTLIGHTLVQLAARRLPPSLVALVSPGESVGSVLIGALSLGLFPSPREALGGAAVIAGATLVVLGARKARA